MINQSGSEAAKFLGLGGGGINLRIFTVSSGVAGWRLVKPTAVNRRGHANSTTSPGSTEKLTTAERVRKSCFNWSSWRPEGTSTTFTWFDHRSPCWVPSTRMRKHPPHPISARGRYSRMDAESVTNPTVVTVHIVSGRWIPNRHHHESPASWCGTVSSRPGSELGTPPANMALSVAASACGKGHCAETSWTQTVVN